MWYAVDNGCLCAFAFAPLPLRLCLCAFAPLRETKTQIYTIALAAMT